MIARSRPSAILLAERDELVRMVTADMLTDEGFETIEVRTAAEAIAVLETRGPVDVLITGRRIWGNGVALAHLVRERWPSVGIIVTTGAGPDLERELPTATRVLQKPFEFSDMIRAVEASLGRMPDEAGDAPATAPLLPEGVPPHTGTELSLGIGVAAAPVTEADKT